MEVFNFTIITVENGIQVIDRTVKTAHSTLTPIELLDYMEMDAQLAFMDRLERKARAEAERRRKLVHNPLYRIACLCGLGVIGR